VTAAKKLFLAAAIVAAGYGVAFVLGRPDPSSVSQQVTGPGERHKSPPSTAAVPAVIDSWFPASLPPGSARLVPDPEAQAASHFHPGENGTKAGEALSNADCVSHSAATTAPRIESIHVPNLFTRATEAQPLPRATLLNEAPRPIANESPCTPALQRFPSPWSANEQYRRIDAPAIRQGAPHDVMPAQFTRTTELLNSQTNAFADASDQTTLGTIGPAPLAPLPFSSIPEVNAPRSHIVVDGDSLAKLAGRYLDDPHRGAEIYEFNRHLLTNPELLPIGVELAIPPRSAVTSAATMSQSSMQRMVASHASTAGGLVPIRPIPHANSMPPRAFLTAPRQPE
jgi:nucleoid-associated protein YgaU